MWLDSNGKQLVQWPIEEVENLRGPEVKIANAKLQKREKIEIKGITPAQVIIFVSSKFIYSIIF